MIPEAAARYLKLPGAKRWYSRYRGPAPAALFPKTWELSIDKGRHPNDRWAYAADADMLHAKDTLVRKLSDMFPPDIRDDGFAGETAVPGGWESLLSVTGSPMDPLPLPQLDNTGFINELGLASNIDAADVPYLNQLIKLFFGHATPEPLRIRKGASTSMPYFDTDTQYKKLGAMKILKNPDNFLDLITGGSASLKLALDTYDTLLLQALHERQQPTTVVDGVPKSRPAPTEEDVRKGRPSTQVADQTAFDHNGNPISGHFAMRRRVVWGSSGLPNYFLTAVMGCFRAVYTKRFAATYKTRGYEDKQERIRKFKYIVGSDVKNMDTTVPPWFFKHLKGELVNYWDERLVEFFDRMIHASVMAPPPWRDTPDDYNPLFGPDPLSGEFSLTPGLPSGVAPNPDIGKLWMTFVYVILFRDAGAIKDPSDIERFLSGGDPENGLYDMSDDATMMTNSTKVYQVLLEGKSKYAVLEVERPVIFLGDVFSMVGGVKYAFPNPLTYVINALVPEKGIQNKDPVLYAEGFLARQQLYSRTPIYRELNDILERTLRPVIGHNISTLARAVAVNDPLPRDIDNLVRANPDYLHYKVDPEDVSPEVLDELVSTIPAIDFYNDIRHLFKVPTVQLEEI